ncbi:MAG: 2-phospho-L-lactate guanylyltransferase CofC [Humibacillus sp.]|nr:2-phospho-L-lactate guanylyltransferase CofC [Humibacillus sp.]
MSPSMSASNGPTSQSSTGPTSDRTNEATSGAAVGVDDASHPWHVVIPVKQTRVGKSRLGPALGVDRARVSRAIADDTITAAVGAVGAQRVTLVTSDAGLAQTWSDVGVRVVADPERGLNAAVVAGCALTPAAGRSAALLGDVPALRPDDLRQALAAALAHDQSFVPDSAGDGTVLRCGRDFVPRFGRDSAARHERDGAVRLELDLPRLRTDVDDGPSLELAGRLGLGGFTRRLLARRHSGWIKDMQATVHSYDPQTGAGSVLTDDGLRLPFDAPTVDASGLRLLRTGQRLTVEVADDVVVSLRIVGIGSDQQIR